ncbi:MAG: NUDIX domain-containing protein [Moorea sp. SIO1G6]|uniref:NUDIX domain-containing protein n=1 Tax=Moorena sp. SIO1G6 TaxID=2607840 RepID=UPI0013BECA48|nr:NUDIX domain-containing protein [Moorena sp. SIO1G6]NET67950.1 NUDIX domain-containing protein [Moorena sp. SIO1G6]
MIIDETWYQRPPGVSEATSAGGIVARRWEQQIYIALVQEGNRLEYVLPKGHVEPGETIVEAAEREIAEEAGLNDLKFIAELGVKERLDFAKQCWKKTYYFLFITDQIDGTPTDPNLSYQLGWFPIDELPTLFWPEQQELIKTNSKLIQKSLGIEQEMGNIKNG